MFVDWQDTRLRGAPPLVVDPRRRLRFCMAAFAVLLAFVWCRAAQLQVTQGAAFRAEALRPIEREKPLPAPRGRILATDGSVFACDKIVAAVAVDYRWLEDPPRAEWLEQEARRRLPKDQRRNSAKLIEEIEKLRRERDDLHQRLAKLCGVDIAEWQAHAHKVQQRVERIAAAARRRRIEAAQASTDTTEAETRSERFWAALHEIFEPAHDAVPAAVTVAEELSDHVLAEDISAATVSEIREHPELFPGTRIVPLTRRDYPHSALAAHVLGYLGRRVGQASSASAGPPMVTAFATGGPALASSLAPPYGVTGVEEQCEMRLRGAPGTAVESVDHAGRVQQTTRAREPMPGSDITLTIDPRLQQTAEELLDSAVRRVALQYGSSRPTGGAIVVVDVRNGEVAALASAPRFDPAVFAGDDSSGRAALLADPAQPLFHRAVQMALPPGSVFKTVTAVALLESGGLDPAATFYCRGYLKRPDEQRCAIFVRRGVGHGDVTLAEALAESCNVYFFHHAANLPPGALATWARRFGFGEATGIDLPGEAKGNVPARKAETQEMAIGQGSLTATPLQVVRMMAAVANGGLLVTPHVIRVGRVSHSVPDYSPKPVPGLTFSTLNVIRAGLLKTVADNEGTAHATLYLPEISISGKTGTATVRADEPEHAWFAGYLPSDRPRYAIVVVLERAGDASIAACPLAKRLVQKMLELGMLKP